MVRNITLDKNTPGHIAKKFSCPSCRQRRYVKYWDAQAQVYLPDEFGRCDRMDHCGYFNQPWDYVKNLKMQTTMFGIKPKKEPKQERKKFKIVDKSVVVNSLTDYDSNSFYNFLSRLVGKDKAIEAMSQFFIGTENGGAIFWQIDSRLQCRTGSRIMYKEDGHRDKDIPPVRLFMKEDGYEPCFFGEHQIFGAPDDCIYAIVESEKTAVLCSIYMPELDGRTVVWLACHGVHGLTDEKMYPLADKDILLVPDCHFLGRATWGLLPMRKKKNEFGNMTPHPDGDLVEGYISVTDRLKKLKCTVRHFDPDNTLDDGSDLGDILALNPLKPSIHLVEPNYFELELIPVKEITPIFEQVVEKKPLEQLLRPTFVTQEILPWER